jgi:hypothetical protein
LVQAGKGIAVAVVSRQMESLTDRLGERTERLSGRLDERIGSLRAGRSGRAVEDSDWADEDPADEWADEDLAEPDHAEPDHAERDHAEPDRTEQDRAARRVAQPRPRRTTTARANGAGSPVRNRTTGGAPGGGRRA